MTGVYPRNLTLDFQDMQHDVLKKRYGTKLISILVSDMVSILKFMFGFPGDTRFPKKQQNVTTGGHEPAARATVGETQQTVNTDPPTGEKPILNLFKVAGTRRKQSPQW